MSFPKVLSLVLILHVAVASLILVQPGCQTLNQDKPDPGDTSPSATTADTRPDTDRGTGMVTVNPREIPVEDAFNAGMANQGTRRTSPAQGVRRAPTRPDGVGMEPGNVVRDPLAPFETGDEDTVPGGFAAGDGDPAEPEDIEYTVEPGDSLWQLSRDFGVSVEDIQAANNLSGSTIRVGQELTIPGAVGGGEDPLDATEGEADTGEATTGGVVHEVQPGDSLWQLSREYGVSVGEIKRENNLSGATIRVGQELTIPVEGETPQGNVSATRNPRPSGMGREVPAGFHRVGPGESFTRIAPRYGMTAGELMALNPEVDPRTLRAGQLIAVDEAASRASSGGQQTGRRAARQAGPARVDGGADTANRVGNADTEDGDTDTAPGFEDLFEGAEYRSVEEVRRNDGG